MTATVTVDTVTDPINTLNEAAVTAAGTCTAANTVSVSIVDSAGTKVGPTSATVSGTGWTLAATNVTALLDGTLIFEATSSDGAADAFAAKAAQKQTSIPGYITLAEMRSALHDPSALDTTLMQSAILAASDAVNAQCGRKFYQKVDTQYFYPDDLWVVSLDDMDLATTTALTVNVDSGYNIPTYSEARTFGTDFICEPKNQSVYGIESWPFSSLRAINGKTWPLHYNEFQQYTIQVTGTWGWPSVPNAIKSATTIIAAFLYKRPEAALGMTALPEIGMMRVRDPDVAMLLQPYTKQSTKFLVA